jgi:predicted Zn-dependent protease
MDLMNEIASGKTLAEVQGITEELGRAMASMAVDELAAGQVDAAQQILEGLAVTNPRDHAVWALLALVEKRRGRPLAARVCAGVAHKLCPGDPQVRLARAEVLLADPDERGVARAELEALASGDEGGVTARARSLLTALGAGSPSP